MVANTEQTQNPTGSDVDTNQANGGKENPNSKLFSQEDVDNVVRKRLAEQKTKYDAQVQDLIRQGIADYDRKQKLTAEERVSEENQKREQELDEKERQITLRENRASAIEVLANKGIDTSLVDFIVDLDQDKMSDNIKTLEKSFNKAVEEAVKQRLAGKAPTDFGNGTQKQTDGETTVSGKHVFRSDNRRSF